MAPPYAELCGAPGVPPHLRASEESILVGGRLGLFYEAERSIDIISCNLPLGGSFARDPDPSKVPSQKGCLCCELLFSSFTSGPWALCTLSHHPHVPEAGSLRDPHFFFFFPDGRGSHPDVLPEATSTNRNLFGSIFSGTPYARGARRNSRSEFSLGRVIQELLACLPHPKKSLSCY